MEEMKIRRIMQADNDAIAKIIKTVMPEFGACGEGFAINDVEVTDMFKAYQQPRSAYFVVEVSGSIIAGGGIAPLQGGEAETCELKKMYMLPPGRGKGLGQQLLSKCMEEAKHMGFRYCYLETFNTMKLAMKLYERNGFEKISGPMGSTGHFSCDVFYKCML